MKHLTILFSALLFVIASILAYGDASAYRPRKYYHPRYHKTYKPQSWATSHPHKKNTSITWCRNHPDKCNHSVAWCDNNPKKCYQEYCKYHTCD